MVLKRIIISVILIVIAIILIFTLFEIIAVSELEFRGVSDLDMDTGLTSIDLFFQLEFYNPSFFTVKLEGLDINVSVSNSVIGSLELISPIDIPGSSVGTVDAKATISYTGTAGAIWNLLVAGDFDYSLDGYAITSFLLFDFSIPLQDVYSGATYSTEITIVNASCILGEPVTIRGSLQSVGVGLEPELNGQTITIQIDGTTFYTTTEYNIFSFCQNGCFELELTASQVNSLGAGTHTITATYDGTFKYLASSETATLQIDTPAVYSTFITLENSDCILGEPVTITGSLQSEGVGLETELNGQTITIQIGGRIFYATTAYDALRYCQNGCFELELTASQVNSIGPGTHTITATFSGTNKYLESTDAAYLQITGSLYASQLTIDDITIEDISIGTTAVVNFKGNLNCVECVIDDICNGKTIYLYYRTSRAQSWQLLGSTTTQWGWTHGNGQIDYAIQFSYTGIYYLKAVFEGDSELSYSYYEISIIAS